MFPASPSTITVPKRRLISLSLSIVGIRAWLLEVWGFRSALPLISSITYQPPRFQANVCSLHSIHHVSSVQQRRKKPITRFQLGLRKIHTSEIFQGKILD